MHHLTERQERIYQFLHDYIVHEGFAPTIREIGKAFGFSNNGVLGHLTALEKKGWITRKSKAARTIQCVDTKVKSNV